jgi:hypothetical protein
MNGRADADGAFDLEVSADLPGEPVRLAEPQPRSDAVLEALEVPRLPVTTNASPATVSTPRSAPCDNPRTPRRSRAAARKPGPAW